MRKIFKIVIAVLVVLIISGVAIFGLIIGDVAGSLATDTKALPNGAAIGKALVVYDPGLSGGAKDTATKIGYNLQSSGYDVTLAGVKSSTAANLSNYKVVVIGGPIYAGKPANSIQTYLNALNPPKETKIGVFGCGSVEIDNINKTAVIQDVAPLPSGTSVTVNAVVKITSQDNVNDLCNEFVTTLLK
jgi:flavodoxin